MKCELCPNRNPIFEEKTFVNSLDEKKLKEIREKDPTKGVPNAKLDEPALNPITKEDCGTYKSTVCINCNRTESQIKEQTSKKLENKLKEEESLWEIQYQTENSRISNLPEFKRKEKLKTDLEVLAKKIPKIEQDYNSHPFDALINSFEKELSETHQREKSSTIISEKAVLLQLQNDIKQKIEKEKASRIKSEVYIKVVKERQLKFFDEYQELQRNLGATLEQLKTVNSQKQEYFKNLKSTIEDLRK